MLIKYLTNTLRLLGKYNKLFCSCRLLLQLLICIADREFHWFKLSTNIERDVGIFRKDEIIS